MPFRRFPSFMVRSRRHAFSKADVVMVVGTPFDFRLAYGTRIAKDAKIIQSIWTIVNWDTTVKSQSASRAI